jgi:hypothetical protein
VLPQLLYRWLHQSGIVWIPPRKLILQCLVQLRVVQGTLRVVQGTSSVAQGTLRVKQGTSSVAQGTLPGCFMVSSIAPNIAELQCNAVCGLVWRNSTVDIATRHGLKSLGLSPSEARVSAPVQSGIGPHPASFTPLSAPLGTTPHRICFTNIKNIYINDLNTFSSDLIPFCCSVFLLCHFFTAVPPITWPGSTVTPLAQRVFCR